MLWSLWKILVLPTGGGQDFEYTVRLDKGQGGTGLGQVRGCRSLLLGMSGAGKD